MQALQSNFPFNIFRAYDIRGKVTLLTPQCICSIAEALADLYLQQQQHKLVLGYDARLSSASYAMLLKCTLERKGLTVILIGQCSSPLMYFSARQTDGNGIMVTASHNEKTDNGIKWILKGLPPTPEMIQHIAQEASHYFNPTPCTVEESHPFIAKQTYEAYETYICQDITLTRPFKVILDGLNGSAGQIAEKLLKKLGCNVIALRCEANGNFPDHAPDPSKEQHLIQLKQFVLQHQADIGLALDGDGDRLVIVDELGQIITADQLLSLFSEMCLKQHAEHEIVFDVKCSAMVKKTIQRWQGIPKMLRTGSTFLRTYLSQSNGQAVFGGEYAGHYVFNDGRGLGYDDGIYAALRILEYLEQSEARTISELLRNYPKTASTQDTYIQVNDIDIQTLLTDFEQASQRLAVECHKIDGIRLDFADGFGIIRASNTGEYFTVRFDAINQARLNQIRETFAFILREKYPKIAQNILDAQ